jgi:hypothetical protein
VAARHADGRASDGQHRFPHCGVLAPGPGDTILCGVVSDQLTTFLAHAESRGRTVPAFVELTRYLECGILTYGFVRVRCSACRCDRVVAFSCKGRGFCPSCGGRRMADTAAFLVDRVLPVVPVRQWVLSLPIALRYKLAYDSELAAEVLQLFVRSVFASLRRRARHEYGIARYDCGRFDSRQLESHLLSNVSVTP